MDASHHKYKRYDAEFKRSSVELVETAGRPLPEIAQQLGIPAKTLESWKTHLRRSRNHPQPAVPDDELTQLRRKLAHVERERDILKKALAICSREDDLRRSSS